MCAIGAAGPLAAFICVPLIVHLVNLSVQVRCLLRKEHVKIYFIIHEWGGPHLNYGIAIKIISPLRSADKSNTEFLGKLHMCHSDWIVSFIVLYQYININWQWYFHLMFWNIWIPSGCDIPLWFAHTHFTLMLMSKISVTYWYHMTLISTDDIFVKFK